MAPQSVRFLVLPDIRLSGTEQKMRYFRLYAEFLCWGFMSLVMFGPRNFGPPHFTRPGPRLDGLMKRNIPHTSITLTYKRDSSISLDKMPHIEPGEHEPNSREAKTVQAALYGFTVHKFPAKSSGASIPCLCIIVHSMSRSLQTFRALLGGCSRLMTPTNFRDLDLC